MSARRLRTAWLLAIAVSIAGVSAGAGAVLVRAAYAEEAEAVSEARKLKKEADEFFRTAGDTELSLKERAAARKETYTRLKEALRLLDGYLDAHPEAEAELDAFYVEIRSMYYWVKKEAGVGEFGPERPDPKPSTPTAPPKKEDDAASGGADAGATGAGADGTQPGEPVPPAGPTAAEALAEIETYAAKFPRDVPGLHERYTDFLAAHPDRDAPEYPKAFERLQQLDRRLKDVYRTLRDDDPDALENVDDARVLQLVEQLSSDLDSPSVPVRVRAAKFLGGLGSGQAATPLVKTLLAEQKGDLYEACADALAQIGGRRVNARLLRVKADSSGGPAVLDVLRRTVRLSGVNARLAGESLGDYVQEFNEVTVRQVAAELFDAGADGAIGLAKVVDLAPTEKKVPYIEHLGQVGDPRVAGHLAAFLTVNPVGARKLMLRAAVDTLTTLGKPAVRYLIPALDDPDVQVWTAEVLFRITGVKQKNDKRKTWEKWYRANRRELESQ